MSWWCSALDRPWDWTPRPYLGVWVLCLATVGAFAWSCRTHRMSTGERLGRRKATQFSIGVAGLWIASDWPIGSLGGGYLSSVHMLQFMLYTLLAAPLLMLGTPEWMARAVLRRTHLRSVWATLSRPLIAGVLTNVLLIATHSPFAVDLLRSSQAGSFALDMVWLASGFILWAPIINPIPECRSSSALVKIAYLFLASALIPMIPGGMIAFAAHPLYSTYELAPRAGLSALEDQQLAGVLMKIGNVPIIWTVMGVIWFQWYERDRAQRPAHRRVPQAGIATEGAVATGGPHARRAADPHRDSSAPS
jgi:putative membrane protein